MYITDEVLSAEKIITDDFCYVQKVVWSGCTTADHKAYVTDKNGLPLFPFHASAAGMYTYEFPLTPMPCNGIRVNDLDSGDLYFYVSAKKDMM
jgi:hypothetical protein